MAQKKKYGLITKFIIGSEKSEGFARASLPSNRWELFWDIFKGRFGKLIVVNLLVLLFCLPFMALLFFRYVAIVNYGMSYPFSQCFGVGYGALPSMVGVAENIVFQVNLMAYLLAPIALMIAAVGIAGGAYVIRNMVWTEGIFVANDFWRGIKQNIKQLLLVAIFFSVIFYVTVLAMSLCDQTLAIGTDIAWLYNLSKILAIILLVAVFIMTLHMITMSVTYELGFMALIKNSFLFTIGLLPHNLFFAFLGLLPFFVFMIGGILGGIGLILIVLFGFSLVLLIWTNYSHWAYDKFINDHIPGAQKNRGIYEKVRSDEAGAIKKYREQLTMAQRNSLNSKPIKPITDDELKLAELPTSFNRRDIERLNESRRALYEDHERYVEAHKNDPEFQVTEADKLIAQEKGEREKRVEKAKKELAKRNKRK